MLLDTYKANNKKLHIGYRHFVKQASKVFIITMLLIGFNLSDAHANEDKGEILTTFHIYSKGEYIGELSDESKLDKLKEDKLKVATEEFEDLSLVIGTDLSIIPERVFTIGPEDEDVLEKLQGTLLVKAEAIGIKIDGELALHVKDQEAYDEVIQALKLQSVTEEELTEYEELDTSIETIPPLKENETRIAKIMMSADVETTSEQVSPEGVLTVDKAIKLLNKGTLEEKKYSVKSGDVLSEIANEYEMSEAKLFEINPKLKEKTVIQPGDKINVTITEPFVEVETHIESKKKEKISYKKKQENDDTLFKGDKKVTQKGSNGEKIITELTLKRNGQVIEKSIEEEQVLVEPTDEVTVVGTKVVPSRGEGSFKWPTVGGYISSTMGTRWGRLHRGIDIARPSSRAILAADNGVVESVGQDGSYGNKIVINHNNGYKTLYAHLSSIDVAVGQTVSQGTNIGVMGSTGNSTGVHLHFEVTKNGSLINPTSVLR